MYSASTTTGEQPAAVIRMSGRSPGCPAIVCVFSDSTCRRDSIPCSRPPNALLALGSVWCGIRYSAPSPPAGDSLNLPVFPN